MRKGKDTTASLETPGADTDVSALAGHRARKSPGVRHPQPTSPSGRPNPVRASGGETAEAAIVSRLLRCRRRRIAVTPARSRPPFDPGELRQVGGVLQEVALHQAAPVPLR